MPSTLPDQQRDILPHTRDANRWMQADAQPAAEAFALLDPQGTGQVDVATLQQAIENVAGVQVGPQALA